MCSRLVSLVLILTLNVTTSFRIDNIKYMQEPKIDGSQSHIYFESNKTITDQTWRTLLGDLPIYLNSVQEVPDESFFTNSSDSFVDAKISGTTVTDLTKYTIDVAHVDMNKLEFEVGLTFPIVNTTGNYNLTVDNDIFHLKGNGGFSVNITDCSIAINITLMLTSNNTLTTKNVTSDFDFDYAHANFDNLGEDEEISEVLNDFINEFIVESMKDMKPTIQGMLEEKLIVLSNFVVSGMTVDELCDVVNSLA